MRRFGISASVAASLTLASVAAAEAGPLTSPGPAYSIAFSSFAPLDTEIFIANADGSGARALLPHPALDSDASFAADGRSIVFTSTRGGSADLYRARVDGSAVERLTDDGAYDGQGALSPDGTALAFVSSRSGQADIWRLELATGALRNLTNHPAGDFRPSWSPDGQWLAFSSDRDSKRPKFAFSTLHSTEIYVMRADGSGARRITQSDAVAGSPAWSADGKRLLYSEADIAELQKIRSPLRTRGTTQIVTIDLATGTRIVLSQGAGEKWSPHWLPGGGVGYASGGPEGGVEILPSAGGAKAGARGEVRSPAWSPNGRQLVFHRDVEGRWPPLRPWPSVDPRFALVRTGIFPAFSPSGDRVLVNDQRAAILKNGLLLTRADGSDPSLLFSHSEQSALAPDWSPDGARIAFGLGRFVAAVQGPASADIAMLKADGSGLEVLTDGARNCGFPSWAPDGRRLVYRAGGKDASGLFILDVASHRSSALTSGAGHDNFPAWSPSGDRIAFTSDRDGDYEIYSVRPDGSDVKRLTRSPGNDAHATWSPDGLWISFVSARGGFKDESALHPYNAQPYGDLYVMRADGSDPRVLTDDPFEDGTPRFKPARHGADRR
jgi:TolB protein